MEKQAAILVMAAALLSVVSCDRAVRPSGGSAHVTSTLFQPNGQAARGAVAVTPRSFCLEPCMRLPLRLLQRLLAPSLAELAVPECWVTFAACSGVGLA